jgi:peptidoglycan/xylan/chitin deacetylase (PgdA/CDA1 family)
VTVTGGRQGCCVLTFHRVVEEREHDHDVRWSTFRTLLDLLATESGGFATDLEHPTSRAVVLTFDDGTEDHLRVAGELAERGAAAIFFVSSGRLGSAGSLDPGHVRELAALGHVVGSHAHDHAPLAGLSDRDLRRQVVESKARLEEVLGTPVSTFAPPGGIGHPALADELERAGYGACRSMRWGVYRTADERWNVPCLPVTEYTIGSGWIRRTVVDGELPPRMRLASLVRSVVPRRSATMLRRRLHAKA